MKNLRDYLGCGNVSINRGAIYFQVTNFSDLTNKIIPILQKYPLQGEKLVDYFDFVKVVELMKNKSHLTEEGLNQIREIKASMNTGRHYVGKLDK